MFENQLKATKDEEEEQAKNKDLVAYCPDPLTGLNANAELGEADKGEYRYNQSEFLDVFVDRQVTVSEKVYQNFLGSLVTDAEDLEIFKMDKATKYDTQHKKELLRKQLQDAVADALKHVFQTLDSLVEAKRAKETAANRYQSRKGEVRQPSKQIEALQQALEDDLSKQEQTARTRLKEHERKRMDAEKQQRLKLM